MADFAHLAHNPVVWLIGVLAAGTFGLLAELLIAPRSAGWHERCEQWMPSLKAMLSSLPLLGLLGTIAGLMKTFRQMAREHGLNSETLMTSGIADAMFTTQMGLVMVVPGWILLAWLGARHRAWMYRQEIGRVTPADGTQP